MGLTVGGCNVYQGKETSALTNEKTKKRAWVEEKKSSCGSRKERNNAGPQYSKGKWGWVRLDLGGLKRALSQKRINGGGRSTKKKRKNRLTQKNTVSSKFI